MYNKHLTLVPIGGLANRFYAVTSALSFCLDNQIALKVIWFKDKGMGAGFHDLFNLDPSLRQDVAVVDAKWSDYIFDRPRKRNFWLPYISQRILFDKIACSDIYNDSKKLYLKALKRLRRMF